MTIFKTPSPDNTAATLQFALEKATELSTDIVLSTTTGTSAVQAVELAAQTGFAGNIIIVTHVWGMKTLGENELTDENRKKLTAAGATIVTAAHALSGAERAISNKFGGAYPVEIMAHTLRMFCQGMKVCVEISSMALDAGAIQPRPVVALGGTGRGLDTACVITPGYTAKIFDTRVHEVLCKLY
ncbi:MAG: hypothetical protein FWC76_08200 [Defluviitaleaceae bacterium]|nr:hypothetical protein [Defluviitaleaceae bacterium]